MGEKRCLFIQRLKRDSHAGGDHPPEIFPFSRDKVHRDGSSEVHDDGGGPVLNQRRIGVYQPVLPNLLWIPVTVFNRGEDCFADNFKREAERQGRFLEEVVPPGDHRTENHSFNFFPVAQDRGEPPFGLDSTRAALRGNPTFPGETSPLEDPADNIRISDINRDDLFYFYCNSPLNQRSAASAAPGLRHAAVPSILFPLATPFHSIVAPSVALVVTA